MFTEDAEFLFSGFQDLVGVEFASRNVVVEFPEVVGYVIDVVSANAVPSVLVDVAVVLVLLS